jgi:hypothetical protein
MMHLKYRLLAIVALHALLVRAAQGVDFSHDVLPLLKKHCVKCHADGRYEADFSIDTREALLETGAAEPGASADSALMERVTSDDADFRMPPEGPALTAAEVDVLRRWIDAGLPWEDGFSFKTAQYEPPLAPRRPELPPAEAGLENPIDRIVQAYWRGHGVTPPPELGDEAFLRRATLDLVGLLPTPDEVAAFVADGDPAKRQAAVDRLLGDRVAYADHWLTFWNDLLRNDYVGVGYIDGGREQITNWLYRSLLHNKPYDEFVRELIAPRPESQGFAKGIVWRGQVNASQRPAVQYAQNVGQVFLGINLKCASCHDSFIDRWKLSDAYGLAAVCSEQPMELYRCDIPTGEQAQAAFLFPELGTIDAAAPREARMAQLAALMTHPQNGRLSRTMVNRLWQRLMGRGIVHPVDAMETPPWSADLLDYLAVHLADSRYDLKQSLRLIATSQVYNSASVGWDAAAPADEYVFAGPAPKRMTAEQFIDAITRVTGFGFEQVENKQAFVKTIGKAQARPFIRAALVRSTPLMRTLGRPNREQVVTVRPAEVTTLEALELSNGRELSELLASGAGKMLTANPEASSEEICRRTFQAALTREPTADELARLVELAGDKPTSEGLSDVLWCIIMLPEFQLVR